jgi:ATP-dependent Lon protease
MFITTANILDTIPPALRDRMEVIKFPGYTEEEKIEIAKGYLIPKQVKAHGLAKRKIAFRKEALQEIVRYYTREAGVRNLEREISSVLRKIAKQIAEKKRVKNRVDKKIIEEFLGPRKFTLWSKEEKNEIGVSTGLAWTQSGGDILAVESTTMPGKGRLILTGKLGDVMKESAQAALSYARSRAKIKVSKKFFVENDIHIHVPEGAIPKDGPSAGVAMATSLVSVLTGKKVKKDVGMTGEITLRGKVLEIGGVKEKVLAAHRSGLKKVILPATNKKDLKEDVPKEVQKDLKFIFVKTLDEVLKEAIA